jgi:predicted transcriptional regulator
LAATTEYDASYTSRCDVDENAVTIETDTGDAIDRTVDLVCAYVANNRVPALELTSLIAITHTALTGLSTASVEAAPMVKQLTPARIRKSITHEALISFEDGKPYKTLKRHLTKLGPSPDDYRAKWGLSRDYPMTAASYSETRSALARNLGLGKPGRKTAPKESAANTTERPKRAGRSRKVKQTT